MREQGTMTFDYRKRCACLTSDIVTGIEYDLIRYGVSAHEMGPPWRVVASPYADLSVGGRKAGNPIELERNQHFFTKHLGRDFHDVPDRGHAVRAAGPQVETSSLNRLEQAALKEGRDRSDHRDAEPEAQEQGEVT